MDGNRATPLSLAQAPHTPWVWAVGGGKGGVGKSLIASSLAYSVAHYGHKTLAIDLDLGGANLHTVLGLNPPPQSLSDFVYDRTSQLSHCAFQSPYPNLQIIAGAHDDLNITKIDSDKQREILEQVRTFNVDVVIIDLGAGTSPYTLEFFNSSDMGIITALPEPTSIENAYRFIKAVYYDRLARAPELFEVRDLIQAMGSPKNTLGLNTPTDLLNEIALRSPDLALCMKQRIAEFKPKLVLNQARSQADIDVGYSMRAVCKKYFGFDLEYLGYLDYDSSVWQSVRRKRSIMVEFPNSKLATTIERMSNYLLKQMKATGHAARR